VTLGDHQVRPLSVNLQLALAGEPRNRMDTAHSRLLLRSVDRDKSRYHLI
jgi:hypothetical protein